MAIRDVFAEMEALLAARVVDDYALGGAVAAIQYVEPAATQDVDIFVVFRTGSAVSLTPLTPARNTLRQLRSTLAGRKTRFG